MSKFGLAGTTAIAALFVGQAAWADVTPEEIWQKWQDTSASMGQTVTNGGENRTGDTLVISDLVIASTADDSAGRVTIPEMSLRDMGDGTVQITFAPSFQIEGQGTGPDDTTTDLVMDVVNSDMVLLASGTVDATNYAVGATALTVALASENGVPAADLGKAVSVTLNGMTGAYQIAGTDLQTIASDLSINTVEIKANVAEPGTDDKFNLTATMQALNTVTNAAIPAAMEPDNTAAALAAGLAVTTGLTFGQTDFAFDFTDAADQGTGTGTMTGGAFGLTLDAEKLNYTTSAKGLDIGIAATSIPLPEVRFGFAETTLGLVMPTAKSDLPAPFGLVLKLVDLTVSDDIWAMADPTGTFPRDPVTVVLDTNGTATVTVDYLDEKVMEELGDVPPGQLNSLDLNELTVRALGAEVKGNGTLTFDNTDMTTFDGVPAPTGTITLNAAGINALLEKLTAMGLIPEDQVMGGRMMLGMFARPGDAPDTLTSVLEFKDGGFFANGMQLK